MIFIAKDHKGRIISIISAKTKESANAYWQGKDIPVHKEEVWDIDAVRQNEELGYVTPILTTRRKKTEQFSNEYIVIIE